MDNQAVSSSNINYQYMFNLFTINNYKKKGFNFLQEMCNYLVTYKLYYFMYMKKFR